VQNVHNTILGGPHSSNRGRFFIGLLLIILAGYLYLENMATPLVQYSLAGIGLLLIIIGSFGNHHMRMQNFGLHLIFSKTSLFFILAITGCVISGYYFSYIEPKFEYVILSGAGLITILFIWKLYFSFAQNIHNSHMSHAMKFFRR
jgi:hypothetical protein